MSLPRMDYVSAGISKEISKKYDLKEKYRVLSMIREHKAVLFGPISSKQSKATRSEKWKQIFAFAASLNVVPVNKGYMYVRDVFWQNCKKYSISKLENCKVGKNLCNLTACDRITLEIIGRGGEADEFEIESDTSFKRGLFASSADSEVSCSVTSTNVMRSRRISKLKKGATLRKETSLGVKKQKLEVEHLQLLNHKTKLEIALMEKQLGLPPSVFTKCVHGYEGNDTTASLNGSFSEKWQYEEDAAATKVDDEVEEEEETKPLINLF